MPPFHHTDEIHHYDYVLKMKRGAERVFKGPLETALLVCYEHYGYPSTLYYTPDLEIQRLDVDNYIGNYIIYHPPLYYKVMSFLISDIRMAMVHLYNIHNIRLVGVFLFLW